MKETTLKGLVHLGLTIAGLVELRNSSTPARKLLVGALVGWHAHATLFHFLYEKDENEDLSEMQNSKREKL
jgi:hypothetical protein